MNYLEEQESQTDDQVKRGLGISFALHALIISVFTLKTVFFDPEPIDFSQAVRVDMVGLPDKVDPKDLAAPPAKENPKPALPEKDPEPPKAVEKPVEKPVEKKPTPPKPEAPKLPPAKPKEDGVNLEKVKSQQKNALEKLKAMAALEKIKEDVADERKKATTSGTGKAATGSTPIKGNVLSPGSSLTGLSKLQHDTYASDLDRHIKQNWALPEWLAKRDFKAQAVVYIDSRGNILGRKIVKSSGNPSYDEEVLATIDRSAPFPAPPEKFLAIVSVDGILIGFPE